jgi:hypothetical protein
MTTSNLRRLASLCMASKPGRLSRPLEPLMPSSRYTASISCPERVATSRSARSWFSVPEGNRRSLAHVSPLCRTTQITSVEPGCARSEDCFKIEHSPSHGRAASQPARGPTAFIT